MQTLHSRHMQHVRKPPFKKAPAPAERQVLSVLENIRLKNLKKIVHECKGIAELAEILSQNPSRLGEYVDGKLPITDSFAFYVEQTMHLAPRWLDDSEGFVPDKLKTLIAKGPKAFLDLEEEEVTVQTQAIVKTAKSVNSHIPEFRKNNLTLMTMQKGAKARLAHLTGISPSIISHLIAGKYSMSDDIAGQITKALGLPTGFLDQSLAADRLPENAANLLSGDKKDGSSETDNTKTESKPQVSAQVLEISAKASTQGPSVGVSAMKNSAIESTERRLKQFSKVFATDDDVAPSAPSAKPEVSASSKAVPKVAAKATEPVVAKAAAKKAAVAKATEPASAAAAAPAAPAARRGRPPKNAATAPEVKPAAQATVKEPAVQKTVQALAEVPAGVAARTVTPAPAKVAPTAEMVQAVTQMPNAPAHGPLTTALLKMISDRAQSGQLTEEKAFKLISTIMADN